MLGIDRDPALRDGPWGPRPRGYSSIDSSMLTFRETIALIALVVLAVCAAVSAVIIVGGSVW